MTSRYTHYRNRKNKELDELREENTKLKDRIKELEFTLMAEKSENSRLRNYVRERWKVII